MSGILSMAHSAVTVLNTEPGCKRPKQAIEIHTFVFFRIRQNIVRLVVDVIGRFEATQRIGRFVM